MKTHFGALTACCVAALVTLESMKADGADATVHYQSQPKDCQVLIQGTSTLHNWEMKGPIIGGSVDFPAGVKFDTNQASLPGLVDGKLAAAVKTTIPVRSIRSEAETRPEYMERLMQAALKETNFARIEYRATELKMSTPHAAGQLFVFDADGELTIAGVTNKINFPVTIEAVDADKIKIHGEAKVKMTDYGVKPPAPDFGLGLMKCGDDVKIIFDWTLQQKTNAAAAKQTP
jgi:polyisoprenoid-binding protein YceI